MKRVSLPKLRSRLLTKENGYCVIKKLSEKQKLWLQLHERTNWNKIGLSQPYLKSSNKQLVFILWKLPGTSIQKESCGRWKYKGCKNLENHPHRKALVRKYQIGCFRANCKTCWLTKWLARESHRATRRIENYQELKQKNGFSRTKPIHVIVSPKWSDKFDRFDILKKKCRDILVDSGLEGGLIIYHPFDYDKEKQAWGVRPHFHIIGFGWIGKIRKEAKKQNWVVKNKGIRKSLHSTIYYQLSHCGVADRIHSVTWFGGLGYRAKYSQEIRVKDEVLEFKCCQFCKYPLREIEYVGTDRPPPPDFEFEALLNPEDWRYVARLCYAHF